MAHIWMRGLKFSNPSALKNLNFVQRGLPFLPKGDTGEDAEFAEKSTNIFTRKPKHGGFILMFSTAATENSKDPQDPGINKGPPPGHDGKGTGKPGKETGSETLKNLHKEREAKKQLEDVAVASTSTSTPA